MKITITYEYENEETKVRLFLIYFSTIYQLGRIVPDPSAAGNFLCFVDP